MIHEKHLTIKEAKNEIKKLEHKLDICLTKKNINFLKTQPKAMQIKDIVVDSSHTNIDVFLNYVNKDEENDVEIYGLLAAIYSYKSYIAKEIKRLCEYDSVGYIRYLREDEKKSWKQIDRILHYSEGYSKTKYYRYISKKNNVNVN